MSDETEGKAGEAPEAPAKAPKASRQKSKATPKAASGVTVVTTAGGYKFKVRG